MCVNVVSPGTGIQTNITNICQTFANLCVNGRCIPTMGIGYRCECNMGFKVNSAGACLGKRLVRERRTVIAYLLRI